jgi:hypothetical protein
MLKESMRFEVVFHKHWSLMMELIYMVLPPMVVGMQMKKPRVGIALGKEHEAWSLPENGAVERGQAKTFEL